MRSYDNREYSNRVDGGVITAVGSNQGVMYFVQKKPRGIGIQNQEWKHHSSKENARRGGEYAFEWNLQKKMVIVPYRVVVPLVALIGLAPWIRSKRSLVEAMLIAAPHIPAIIARLH